MPRKPKTNREWRTVKRFQPDVSSISEAYHLENVSDRSIWYAVKLDEHDKFLNDVISEIQKVREVLDGRVQPLPAKNAELKLNEQNLYCTRCGSKEILGHNYCGRCGERLASKQA